MSLYFDYTRSDFKFIYKVTRNMDNRMTRVINKTDINAISMQILQSTQKVKSRESKSEADENPQKIDRCK